MKKVIVFVFGFFLMGISQATIIQVPQDEPTIQAGIDAAVDGDTVLVDTGRYVENINFNGKNIVVGSLFIMTGDTSYVSQTVIDGDSSGSVVTFYGGEDSSAVLSGFTITNGSGAFNMFGGGIYCSGSAPRLQNLVVVGNTAFSFGGGIACRDNSNPELINLVVANNFAVISGGGISFQYSSALLHNVVVSGNRTRQSDGGGIYCTHSNLTLENVELSKNSAPRGGGIWCLSSEISYENGTISGNLATGANERYGAGGGIFSFSSSINMQNVEIRNNLVNGDYGAGGGIFLEESRTVLKYMAIWGNRVIGAGNGGYDAGGGVAYRGGSAYFVNVTLTQNAADSGGAVFSMAGAPIIVNSILWGNSQPEISLIKSWGWVSAWHSDIQGGWEGERNIDDDPLFVDAQSGDFRLREGSPCIDTGRTLVIAWPGDTLLDLTPDDYVGFAPDMGAYEYSTLALLTLSEFTLRQNFPNPFNETTTIRYTLPDPSFITVVIYDLLGREVRTLVNEYHDKGYKSVIWDGRNNYGERVSSSIYLYQLYSKNFTHTRKMVLLK